MTKLKRDNYLDLLMYLDKNISDKYLSSEIFMSDKDKEKFVAEAISLRKNLVKRQKQLAERDKKDEQDK